MQNIICMELKNETFFFIGIGFLMLGLLIIIFDYPQIQFLDKVKSEQDYGYLEISDVHERLKIEISIGMSFLIIGIVLPVVSFLKGFKNRFR